ncbi:MAG: LytTR family DNA-binding domain-containing protein [Lacrimispora sp.]|uniref:LytTR family transcriptional regulator DNA-binding domain-containing protein n=1 Tax=Lacrimispora sp. TaxID=2719234 RepID=UPI0039E25BE5
MKIAFCTDQEKLQELVMRYCRDNDNGFLKIDCFSTEEPFAAMEDMPYDMIVIYRKKKAVSWREITRRERALRRRGVSRSTAKYTAIFNGKIRIFDTRDILYLESYQRKTSVVVGRERLRIKARLDEEEGKLPRDFFIRINRHNIINMQHIRNVEGEAVEMGNGEILYINDGRRKKFERNYRKFIEENSMIL